MTSSSEPQLENYTLETELRRSDLTTVYQGRRKSDQTLVTIEIANTPFVFDELFEYRFKEKARQAAKLDHPNIIPTYEAEQERDILYIVRDFTQASSLAQILETEGPFSPERMLMIARQLASALDHAHHNSVTHGDLSAQRIYLGPNDHVFIADFGQIQPISGANLMKYGYAGNSPETVAPERVQGQAPSRHSDLYALGILCYQMLAKRPPFTGAPSSILHAQTYKQPRPLYLLNPAISAPLSQAIERMLAKGVELRYNTGAEFARALAVGYLQGKRAKAQKGFFTLKRLLYWGGTVLALLIMAISVRAGYEIGVRRSTSTVVTVPAGASQTTPSATPTATAISLSLTERLLPTFTLTPRPLSLHDTLRPTPESTRTPQPPPDTPSPTPTSAPATVISKPTQAPTSLGPAIPAGKGLLLFHNPTGHDLIIDLTGPASASALVPPYSQQTFMLDSGSYQYIVHTLTGKWLETKTIYFDVPAGQVIEKDYYSN